MSVKLHKEFMKSRSVALVGARKRKEKWGYKLLKKLEEFDFDVIPVNPGLDFIEGKKCYKDVSSIDKAVDAVVFVVNPDIGRTMVESVHEKGIDRVWLQPGAYDEDLIKRFRDVDIEPVHDICIKVYLNRNGR
ncbi:MAG: CoA-binding protein [Candidatus Muiribacteriaceae bacterium]